MGGTDRVAVDALGGDLLSPPPLKGLVDAENEWPLLDERLYEQSQQEMRLTSQLDQLARLRTRW
jgi:hypothetical protein